LGDHSLSTACTSGFDRFDVITPNSASSAVEVAAGVLERHDRVGEGRRLGVGDHRLELGERQRRGVRRRHLAAASSRSHGGTPP
jgi:hypothetical protein